MYPETESKSKAMDFYSLQKTLVVRMNKSFLTQYSWQPTPLISKRAIQKTAETAETSGDLVVSKTADREVASKSTCKDLRKCTTT